MSSLKWLFLLLFVGSAAVVGVMFGWDYIKADKITSFETCKAAGNPVILSNPEQCIANGQTFVNE